MNTIENRKIYAALPATTCKILQEYHDHPWPSMTIHDHALEMNEIHGIHGTWKRRFWCELWSPWAGRFDNVLTQCHTGWDQASARRSAKASGSNRLNEISMSPDHFVLVSSSFFIYVRLTLIDCVSYILYNNTYNINTMYSTISMMCLEVEFRCWTQGHTILLSQTRHNHGNRATTLDHPRPGLVDFIARLDVDPSVVRATTSCKALGNFGEALRSGGTCGPLQRLHLYLKSNSVEEIGGIQEFWSHSWHMAPWKKIMCLLMLKNGVAAGVLGHLATSGTSTHSYNGARTHRTVVKGMVWYGMIHHQS